MNRRSFLAALSLAPVAAKVTPAPTQADFDAFLAVAKTRQLGRHPVWNTAWNQTATELYNHEYDRLRYAAMLRG